MADNIIGFVFALGFGLFAMSNIESNQAVWGIVSFVCGMVAGLRLMRIITEKDG